MMSGGHHCLTLCLSLEMLEVSVQVSPTFLNPDFLLVSMCSAKEIFRDV